MLLIITFVFFMFIFSPQHLLTSARSVSMSSTSLSLSPMTIMSSTNLKWLNFSPFISIPISSQSIDRLTDMTPALPCRCHILESPITTVSYLLFNFVVPYLCVLLKSTCIDLRSLFRTESMQEDLKKNLGNQV